MASTTMPKNNKRALIAALTGSGMDDMNVMFLSFALSSIIADLGLSGAQGGLISTITNLGMLLGGLVFGVLADRKGNVKLFKWSIIIFSIATAALFFVDSFLWICILRFIAGIGAGGEYGIAMSIIAKISCWFCHSVYRLERLIPIRINSSGTCTLVTLFCGRRL